MMFERRVARLCARYGTKVHSFHHLTRSATSAEAEGVTADLRHRGLCETQLLCDIAGVVDNLDSWDLARTPVQAAGPCIPAKKILACTGQGDHRAALTRG
jgi:hypothetical protein